MCFVFIWEQTATCATYNINWLVFITEMKSVYRAVLTGSLNIAACASSVKPIGYMMHQQFNIQQLYALPHAVFKCSVFIWGKNPGVYPWVVRRTGPTAGVYCPCRESNPRSWLPVRRLVAVPLRYLSLGESGCDVIVDLAVWTPYGTSCSIMAQKAEPKESLQCATADDKLKNSQQTYLALRQGI